MHMRPKRLRTSRPPGSGLYREPRRLQTCNAGQGGEGPLPFTPLPIGVASSVSQLGDCPAESLGVAEPKLNASAACYTTKGGWLVLDVSRATFGHGLRLAIRTSTLTPIPSIEKQAGPSPL